MASKDDFHQTEVKGEYFWTSKPHYDDILNITYGEVEMSVVCYINSGDIRTALNTNLIYYLLQIKKITVLEDLWSLKVEFLKLLEFKEDELTKIIQLSERAKFDNLVNDAITLCNISYLYACGMRPYKQNCGNYSFSAINILRFLQNEKLILQKLGDYSSSIEIYYDFESKRITKDVIAGGADTTKYPLFVTSTILERYYRGYLFPVFIK